LDRERLLVVRDGDRELECRRLAGEDGSGRAQALNDDSVVSGTPLTVEDQALRRGWRVLRGDDVLHAQGDALQRAVVNTSREVGIGLPSRRRVRHRQCG